jgi:hypothetical protein
MNAFGQSFDTAVNSFGIDFNSVNSAFGLNGFNPPSPPADPLVANYDFNFYTEFDGSIDDQTGISGSATINEPAQNIFDQSDTNNKFLTIYAPDIFPSSTGGVLTPSIPNAQCVEIWVKYIDAGSYGQYLFDFRNGLSNGYWITYGGGYSSDTIGPGQQGAEFYSDGVFLQTVTADQPAIAPFLAGKGWFQIVVNYPTPFTDDMSFFMNAGGNQGFPVSVGQICIYNRQLTPAEIQTIYNNKISRYEP